MRVLVGALGDLEEVVRERARFALEKIETPEAQETPNAAGQSVPSE
jgi:hypothetical protein